MAGLRLFSLAASVFVLGTLSHANPASVDATEGLLGGGPLGRPDLREGVAHDCVRPQDRSRIEAIERAAAASADERGVGVPRFTFFPQAGRLHRDLIVSNYVDLAGGSLIRDWRCSAIAYDGHNGHDVGLRSFGEQEVGVPVYAVLDGTVIDADDGHPDMNTSAENQPANYVIVDHGGGLTTWYFHLRNGSVEVGIGEQVVAGQQVGLTASSGNSTGPHLHFETRRFGSRREPQSGACNGLPSLWTDQVGWDEGVYPVDAGITEKNLANEQPLPFELPRTNQISLTEDDFVSLWIMMHGLPENSTWQAKIIRANGTLGLQTAVFSFNNPYYPWSWWWWRYNKSALGGMVGTARFQIFINGELTIDAPLEGVLVRDPLFNRDPAPIDATILPAGSVVPRSPVVGDVLVCEIDTDLVHDDPDYDIVRFEYVWTADGAEVRRITSAAHSDVLPATLASAAGLATTVRCEVTPSDGRGGFGPTAVAEVMVLPPCPGDATGDRVIDFDDLNLVVGEFNQTVFDVGLAGDVNQDGFVDFNDLNEVVSGFNTACD